MDEESQQKLFNKWLEAVSANSTSPSAESIFGTSGEDNNGMVMMMLPDWIPPGLQQFVRDEGVAQVSGEVVRVCVWEIAPVSLCSARVSLPLTPPLPSNRWIPTASRNA